MDSGVVICEICHEDFDPVEFEKLRKEFDEKIYRPGEDIAKLADLTDKQKSERRREIEAAFAAARNGDN